ESFTKIYNNWLENIEDWCVSRQLWWGHRIPAWYTPEGEIIVARDEAEARRRLAAGGKDSTVALRQDEDVLDTWFSSQLWPFSTLGWPGQIEDLLPDFGPRDRTGHHLLLGRANDHDGPEIHRRRAVPHGLH